MERQQSMRRTASTVSAFRAEAREEAAPLTQAELNAAVDIILKASNPNLTSVPVYFDFKKDTRAFKFQPTVDHTATHLALEGSVIRADTDEARRMEEERRRRELERDRAEEAERNPDLVEQGVSTKILKNQFNYCDRASQTLNPPLRGRTVITDPPPSITIAAQATQWDIYDAYEEDRIAAERAAAAGKAQAAASPGKGRKGGAALVDAAAAQASAGPSGAEDVLRSGAYRDALCILERMVNQNDCDDIIDDFKYWEDASDQYRDEGNLLPLWRFFSDKVRKKEVTSIAWNPKFTDLFAVGYGSYDFLRQGTGAVLCFSLKNAVPQPKVDAAHGKPLEAALPATPEYIMQLDSGVTALDFHPKQPWLLAVGLYDGTVCVFDLRQRDADKTLKPVFQSTVRTGKHTDPVWDIRWAQEAPPSGAMAQFFSISSDGRVTSWLLNKNELQFQDVLRLTTAGVEGAPAAAAAASAAVAADPDAALLSLSGGTCFDFNWQDDGIFVVGTEDGLVRRCSKAYSARYLNAYEGHHMAVYAVRWNRFHPSVFLSCGADWTVKLWEASSPRPLLSFDLSNSVGDVAWAPYSSTVFAAVTSNGKVHVFDLSKNKNEPLCTQSVVKNAKLNRIAFNPRDPVILVGDTRGSVLSLKLSPNLRQKPKLEKGAATDAAATRQREVEKLNRLIEITIKDRELLDR
jgi:dynein intermediate chain 1